VFGFFIYISASLGLLARHSVNLSSIVFNHIVLGLILGTISMVVVSHIPYALWRTYSFYLFVASLILTALVFIPGIGVTHGGAHRWIAISSFTFQPSELLKIGYIIYMASWFASVKDKVATFRFGLLPFLCITACAGLVTLTQPDTDTFLVIAAAGLVVFIAAGARKRDILILLLIGVVGLVSVAFARPYIMDRIKTFFDPSRDPQGSGYQVQQSLIAIGSGGLTGRGFGQSIQKFNFLPEPVGDSIFAVAAEEFGFIGATILIFLYVALALRGLRIASRSPDTFGRLVTSGIVILIVIQSFINIAAMLAVIPLSGLPLIFVSHGGTALLATLVQVGIVLNVSKYIKKA
jgi:cell division protein FtsW